MRHYKEKVNIIIMRDKGPRRSISIRRGSFILLLLFFLSLPFITVTLSAHCYSLWRENERLQESIERFESDYQDAEARAERLENLEQFLEEDNIAGREQLLRQLAAKADAVEEQRETREDDAADASGAETTEGPGHEEFPVLDTGRVAVSNVQARAIRGRNIRISLDLRNPENSPLLSGEVTAVLLGANGEKIPLVFSPREVGSFRISRFKRTVMNAPIPKDASVVNSQVIIEVKDQDGTPIYRNVFAVQR